MARIPKYKVGDVVELLCMPQGVPSNTGVIVEVSEDYMAYRIEGHYNPMAKGILWWYLENDMKLVDRIPSKSLTAFFD